MKTKTILHVILLAAAALLPATAQAQNWLHGEIEASHPWRQLNNHTLQSNGVRPRFHFHSSNGNVYFYQDSAGNVIRFAGNSKRYVDVKALEATITYSEDYTEMMKKGAWDYTNYSHCVLATFSDGTKEKIVLWK